MANTGSPTAGMPADNGTDAGSWPAWLVVAIVIVAAFYSFSPRPHPVFPASQLRADQLLVTGLARDGARIIGVGEQGRILYADDPQGPWQVAKVEPQRESNLNQVLPLGEGVWLAVGHDSWILRSEDNGQSWKGVVFDAKRSEPLLGISGPFGGRLFAYGAFGQYLTSGDGGLSWQRESHPALGDRHLNSMVRTDDGSLIMAGERGLLARSRDNGQSWTALPEIYPGSFYGALVLPANGLLVYGMRGNAYYSYDAGQSWKKSQVPEPVSLFGGIVTPEGEIMLVGGGNAVFVSKDGGGRFARDSHGGRLNLTAVLPLSGGGRLTGGEGGIRIRQEQTNDGR